MGQIWDFFRSYSAERKRMESDMKKLRIYPICGQIWQPWCRARSQIYGLVVVSGTQVATALLPAFYFTTHRLLQLATRVSITQIWQLWLWGSTDTHCCQGRCRYWQTAKCIYTYITSVFCHCCISYFFVSLLKSHTNRRRPWRVISLTDWPLVTTDSLFTHFKRIT